MRAKQRICTGSVAATTELSVSARECESGKSERKGGGERWADKTGLNDDATVQPL